MGVLFGVGNPLKKDKPMSASVPGGTRVELAFRGVARPFSHGSGHIGGAMV